MIGKSFVENNEDADLFLDIASNDKEIMFNLSLLRILLKQALLVEYVDCKGPVEAHFENSNINNPISSEVIKIIGKLNNVPKLLTLCLLRKLILNYIPKMNIAF